MRTIDTLPYKIIIGSHALSLVSEQISALSPVPDKIFVVADINALRFHGEKLRAELDKTNIPCVIYNFDASENMKSFKFANMLLHEFAAASLTRRSLVIAFGGGVTGDLTGFCAAIYMRGIRFASLPTTLIACADSSIGGKTAVNSDFGKNLIGAFYDPSFILSDTSLLSTLPHSELSCGMAEAIKCAVIDGGEAFESVYGACVELSAGTLSEEMLCRVIYACAVLKSRLVALDPHDYSQRRLLNFGHTIGHAIEHIENTEGGGISHGAAVAVGMTAASRLGALLGKCGDDFISRLISMLSLCSLKSKTEVDKGKIMRFVEHDKKREGGFIDFVLPNGSGCEIVPLSFEFIESELDHIL